MLNKKAFELYKDLRLSAQKYIEEIHCPLVIQTIASTGRITKFCKEAKICTATFHKWKIKFPLFNECFQIGCIYAREAWEEELASHLENPKFNYKAWSDMGLRNSIYHDQNKIRVKVEADATPWEQYKQIIEQCSKGDFSAAEIKQLMESINVGTRVYEAFQLQKEVDKMKDDLNQMSQRNGNNIVPISKVKT